MKKALLYFTHCFSLLSGLHAYAQTWSPVGSDGPYTGYQLTAMAIDKNSVPYVMADGYLSASVMKYQDGNWVFVGAPGFSAGSVEFPSIAIDSQGTPYVAYQDYGNGERATVMKYDGSNWVNVGVAGFSEGLAYYTTMAIDTGGTPFVAYKDNGNGGKATVMKYSGSSWIPVGSPGFSADSSQALYTSIAIDRNGIPYVAYEDVTYGDSTYLGGPVQYIISAGITVMKYDGSSWVLVGSSRFSAGDVNYTTIAMDNSGTPYVAYEDKANGNKATVMKYNGSVWETVGGTGFSALATDAISMAIDKSGAPYVFFAGDNGTVMKYTDTGWARICNSHISTVSLFGTGVNTSIAMDTSGTPYVSFTDPCTTCSSVMRLDMTTGVTNVSNPVNTDVKVFPNPTNSIFNINISSAVNEDAKIIITNVEGERVKEWTTATNKQIDVNLDAPAGVYFITVITNEGKQITRATVCK